MGEIQYGMRVANALSGFDVGQSVAICERACVALEAMGHQVACVDHGAPPWFKIKNRVVKTWSKRRERLGIRAAGVVVANSEKTRRELIMDPPVDEHAFAFAIRKAGA